MPTVQRFEDLDVWHDARELVRCVYELTPKLPKHETYGLASQMRRASVSVLSNTAGGFERGSNTEFIQFLFIARGSCGELRADTYVALDPKYGTESQITNLRMRYDRLARRLQRPIEYLKQSEIKGQKFHEERALYEFQEPET